MDIKYATKIDYIRGMIKHEIDAYEFNHLEAQKKGNLESSFYFEGGRDALKWILAKIEEK